MSKEIPPRNTTLCSNHMLFAEHKALFVTPDPLKYSKKLIKPAEVLSKC